MRIATIVITALILLATRAEAQPAGGMVDVSSVDIFFETAEKLMAGEEIPESLWERLAVSPGYTILCDHFGRKRVTDCIKLGYDDRLRGQRDDILADTLDEERMFTAFVVRNLMDMKDNWDELKQFRQEFDFGGLKSRSVDCLKDFLIDPVDSLVVFPSVNFLCFDKNGRKLDMGITIDLNLAYSKTEEELVKFLAHEMFHEYLDNLYDEELNALSPAYYGLGILLNEGVADLVDKTRPEDTVDDPNIPESIVRQYMETFLGTPGVLEEFDRQVLAYLNGDMEGSALYRNMNKLIPFDGHANGHFMTLMIRKHGLLPCLMEDVADPLHFARVYNEAAAAEGSYVFTTEFMEHLTQVRN